MIKFSICIPSYKSKFFKECIESILSQEYQNFELIIINDNSPEPIEQIVQGFNDKRISYYKNELNVGGAKLVKNWNSCLEKASGEYIVIMGDDDLMEADYLTEFISLISKYPDLDVYHCRSKVINDDGNYLMLTPSWPEFETVYDSIWMRLTERRAQYISDFVYKTSTLRANGGFYDLPYAWGSDDITAFIASGNKGLAHTNKTVFNYRSNQLSITTTGNYYIKMDSNLLYEDWLRSFLKSNQPKTVDEKIIHDLLIKDIDKLMMKRKVYVMSKSLVTNAFSTGIKWFKLRNIYKIKLTHIIYSFINAQKQRRTIASTN